jgi:hypothetical protein
VTSRRKEGAEESQSKRGPTEPAVLAGRQADRDPEYTVKIDWDWPDPEYTVKIASDAAPIEAGVLGSIQHAAAAE